MSGLRQFFKAMAMAANKLQSEEDDFTGDDGDGMGNASSTMVSGGSGKLTSGKWKLYTFINGVELRAVCDGEKRGVFADEPGIYYATARELVTLVEEKAEGTSTSKSHSKDRIKIEMLGANVLEVAKMQLGRLMRDWKRDHPPKKVFQPYTEREMLKLQKERQARRVTMYGDDGRLPKMGPPTEKQQREQERLQRQSRVSLEDGESEASSEEETEGKHLSRKEQKKLQKEKRRRKKAAKEAEAKLAKAKAFKEACEEESEDEDEESGGETSPSGGEESDQQGLSEAEESQPSYSEEEGDGDAHEDGKYVYVQVPMTFAALAAEFIACFRNLEELSVKYYDDRVRGFPAFEYQHNPLTRIISLRNSITDLEQAQEQVFGSREAAASYVRNHFPGSEILNLYLRGFPDRFRDQLNQAVTTEQRYVSNWETVVSRVEEMLYTWNRTRDVVYIGLLAQIKSKKGQVRGGDDMIGESKSRNKQRGGVQLSGEKLYPGSALNLNFVNSIGDVEEAGSDHEEPANKKRAAGDAMVVSRSDLQSIIAAALANVGSDSVLDKARTQDRNRRKELARASSQTRFRSDTRQHSGSSGFNQRTKPRRGSTTMIGSLTWEEAKRIADEWQAKLARDAPKGLNLCVWCHQWNFLHIAYGCPHSTYERSATAMPVNDYPASREAQATLRVQDEETLESYKATHGGRTPREVRGHKNNNRGGYGKGSGGGDGRYGPRSYERNKDFR